MDRGLGLGFLVATRLRTVNAIEHNDPVSRLDTQLSQRSEPSDTDPGRTTCTCYVSTIPVSMPLASAALPRLTYIVEVEVLPED